MPFSVCVCYGQGYSGGPRDMSYHDGNAVDGAPKYFERLVEELCFYIRSTLNEIGFESDRYCTKQA